MSQQTTIRFDDLLAGFDWVSAEPMENSAYVSRKTGLVHWHSATMELDDELPEDVEDASIYLAVPCKADLGLGKALVLQFVRETMPDAYRKVDAIFHHRGAYAKYKDLLALHDLLDAWHEYEASQVEIALRAWAAGEGLAVESAIQQDEG